MSNVPVSKRKSEFRAEDNLLTLRKTITDLVMNNFGFTKSAATKKLNHYMESIKSRKDSDALIRNRKNLYNTYLTWFIPTERNVILRIYQKIVENFEAGNNIYPSGKKPLTLYEFCQRRQYLTSAVSQCYVLIQELQYIAETLPSDKNQFEKIEKAIKDEIKLIKGVRSASNKFLPKSDDE